MTHAAHAPTSISTKPAKTRITWVDVAKGVAMFLVFFGHLGTQWFPALAGTLAAIYTFHMPLFFVASGFFFHARYSFGQLAKKRALMLLVPYYIFSVLALAKPVAQLLSPSLYKSGGGSMGDVLSSILTIILAQGNAGLWFLWAVFTGQLLLWGVVRLVRNRIPVLMTVMIVFIVLDFLFQLVSWRNLLPFQLGKIFESTAYMGFGYVIGQTQDLRAWQDKRTVAPRSVVMVGAAVLFVLFDWLQVSAFFGALPLPVEWLVKFVTTVSAIAAVLMVCTLLPQWQWLQTVGKDSLVFYGVNDFMLKIVKFAVFSVGGVSAAHWPFVAQLGGGIVVVVAAMALSAVVNLVVQRHARWAVGDFSRRR
ncbi:acyltransferase family protein [Bifidobacterium parmae]|uniref:Acyltransferase n=1 Tax=Bifidobacterium parmae TaxID=361854 RepID=A0A2N5J0G5_9BIFI|nr:acyltransferase family protein [Bifidobacterium parmae]PLS27708.1 acyltransferase [Bifidobacterium parmae]